jgi:hypothetical protein
MEMADIEAWSGSRKSSRDIKGWVVERDGLGSEYEMNEKGQHGFSPSLVLHRLENGICVWVCF